MIGRENEGRLVGVAGTSGGPADRIDELPYTIELWTPARDEVERTLGRALSVHLARSIFTAAQTEFPARRITLRRATEIVDDTHKSRP
jgi:hypothetical protein